MNETLFYVFGIGLCVAAVIVAFVGLRWEKFPGTRPVLVAGTVAFAALVIAATTFAWRNAEDEQEHREHELAQAEQENLEEGDTGEALEEGATTVEETTTTTASADGAQVFEDQSCGGCHTLAAAGTTGTVGPALDASLKGQDEEFIRTAIVDPNAEIAQGFPPDVMPQNYEEVLSPEELDALVTYLFESANSKPSATEN
jgi:mono/diheme cytochrome c family protein